MNTLLATIKSLLLSPRQAMQELAARAAPTPDADATASNAARHAFVHHLMPLAAIPAVAQFIGSSIIGLSFAGMTFRVPFFKGLVGMVLTYLLTLAGAAILAAILRALAPRYGGQADFNRAMPLVAYGATAAMLGSVLAALPWLAILATVAGLYSLYTLYVGLPLFMQNDPSKSLRYFLLSIVLALVCNVLLSLLLQPFGPHRLVEQARTSAAQERLLAPGELPPEAARALEWLSEASKRLAEQPR